MLQNSLAHHPLHDYFIHSREPYHDFPYMSHPILMDTPKSEAYNYLITPSINFTKNMLELAK